MIKSITAINPLDESILLELAAPSNSGFAVLNVEGLGPCKADINSTELATSDGSIFNSSRVTSRNIVMDLRFLWKPTIEIMRQLSYKYFPIKKKVTLIIETDQRTVTTEGWIESNEPNIFSSREGCQISIVCPDSYMYSIGTTTTILAGTAPGFTFPFSNESVTENLIVFGDLKSTNDANIVYEGDAEIGVTISIHATGTVTNLAIYNASTREIMTIDTDKLTTLTGSPIIAGDDIEISTIRGQKHVTLLRNGVEINILNTIEKPIIWFQLQKGDNVFAYVADSGAEDVTIRIENKTRYEGV